ncbi:zf-HC2 domain-containing protein [Streptomyces orinoci]|uniref:Zf-HC2 domain-containing protein n=1 Tax=Streptomyces orinoci TaxID=67339 RepID=A0ABV3K648_STRON|nr:zf-HC2 domain-containing protein [Streptomyces orinoci]
MTSTTGTDGHPEVAEISALTEGVLPPGRTADLREHLAGCALCTDVRSSLDEIRRSLGTLPGPVRMPADVAGRIDAALAAEALLDATAPRTVSRETTVPAPGPVSRETAEAAETVATASGNTNTKATATDRVSRETGDRPPARPRAATGPGRGPSAGPSTGPGRRRRWPRALLGTACAAAVISVGSFLLQSGGDGGTRAHQGTPTPAKTLAAADLRSQVHTLLNSHEPSESRGLSAQNSSETLRDSGTTAPACVSEGIGRSEPALATRQENFSGTEAYLVVLPHPGDDSVVDAYVVSAACASASPSVPGRVLAHQTVPRS